MDSTNKPVYIYALIDPRHRGIRRIRYIGKSVNPEQRLREHVKSVRGGRDLNKRKCRWLSGLLEAGLFPQMQILCEADAASWQEAERQAIAELRAAGGHLTNASAGGDGVTCPRTPEWAKRIGDAHRGKVISAEGRANMSVAQKALNESGCKRGHPWTPENTAYSTSASGRMVRFCQICRKVSSNNYKRRKGVNVGAGHRRGPIKSHCNKGHRYDETTTYTTPNGSRFCRICSNERTKMYKRRKYEEKRASLCRNHLHPLTEENALYVTKANGHITRTCLPCREQQVIRRRQRYSDNRIEINQRVRERKGRTPRHLHTHCRNGHPYTPENTYRVPATGTRVCRTCRKATQDAWKARQKSP